LGEGSWEMKGNASRCARSVGRGADGGADHDERLVVILVLMTCEHYLGNAWYGVSWELQRVDA